MITQISKDVGFTTNGIQSQQSSDVAEGIILDELEESQRKLQFEMQKSEARQLKLAEQLVGFQSDMQGYFNHLSNNLDAILLQLSNLSEAIGLQDDFPQFHKLSCSPPMSSHKTEMEFARLPPNQSMSLLSFSSDDTKLESEVPVEALNHALITAKEVDSFTTKTIEKEEQHVFDEMLEPENLEILDAPHMFEEVPGLILVLSNYADAVAEMEVPLSPLVLSHRAAAIYQAKYALEFLQSADFLPDSKGNFDPGGGFIVFDERPNIYFPCVVANLKTIVALYEEEQKLENIHVFDPGDLVLFSLNVVDYSGKEVIFNGCSVAFSFRYIVSGFSSDCQGCENNHNNYQFLGKIVPPQSCLLISKISFVLVGEWIEVWYNKRLAISRISCFVMSLVLLTALKLLCGNEEQYSILVHSDLVHCPYLCEDVNMSSKFLFASLSTVVVVYLECYGWKVMISLCFMACVRQRVSNKLGEGFNLDVIIMLGVFSVCHGGLFDKGKRLFSKMVDVRLIPRIEYYGCLTDFLGRIGQWNEVQRLIESMPYEAILIIMYHFIFTCSYFMDVVKAKNECAAKKNETKEMKVDADDSTAKGNLNNLRIQWQRIREQLFLAGLNLPADPTAFGEGQEPANPASEVFQQVYLNCFVCNSMEMGAQIELKKSEIAHLWDMLHYFEVVNQEMSQRNQKVAGKIWQQKNLSHLRVVVQGMAPSEVNDQYFNDLLMKINVRLDGVSFMLAGELPIIDFANIMFVDSNKPQEDMAYPSCIKLEFDQPPLKFLPQLRVLGTRLFQGGSNVVYLARLKGMKWCVMGIRMAEELEVAVVEAGGGAAELGAQGSIKIAA